MQKFVDAPALNVRMGSGVDSPKIGVLFLGQSVEVVGEADDPGWLEVKATLTGAQLTGFVSRKFLREPVSDSRERLIAEAVKEWMRFDRGLGKEYTDPYYRYVGEMWSAIGSNLDGKDTDVPWSAAAISFIVRNAGAGYQEFKFAAAHARYIHESIRKRESNEDDTPFWGYRLHERAPMLGDIVCRWRESEIDYDHARLRNDFKSHCDIIVKVDSERNEVYSIGGNVSHSVSITTYDLGPGDMLAPTKGVFALLANRTDY